MDPRSDPRSDPLDITMAIKQLINIFMDNNTSSDDYFNWYYNEHNLFIVDQRGINFATFAGFNVKYVFMYEYDAKLELSLFVGNSEVMVIFYKEYVELLNKKIYYSSYNVDQLLRIITHELKKKEFMESRESESKIPSLPSLRFI